MFYFSLVDVFVTDNNNNEVHVTVRLKVSIVEFIDEVYQRMEFYIFWTCLQQSVKVQSSTFDTRSNNLLTSGNWHIVLDLD